MKTSHGLIVVLLGSCVLALSCWQARADELPHNGTVFPASPIAFEPVFLVLPDREISLDSCPEYPAELQKVVLASNVLRVTAAQIKNGPPPSSCRRYWLSLGSFPEGDYQVELFLNDAETPNQTYAFSVTDPSYGISESPAHNYSGFYWDPLESGSSLQVIQTGRESLGAVLLTYDDDGLQQWIVIGAGSWQSPGRYVGKAWKTKNGHPIISPAPLERIDAESELIGDATIDFGGGLGVDPNHASITVFVNDEPQYHRDYRRFEF